LKGLDVNAFKTKHYSGHITTKIDDFSESYDHQLFSWLFHPANSDGSPVDDSGTASATGKKPLLIWLNGGPACSSMDGLWVENGPFRLEEGSEDKININKFSWHRAPAYTLYVDQPVGTGLSYSRTKQWAKTDKEINEYFYGFLTNFFSIHNYLLEGSETVDVFFAGESHAGHYIPSMVKYIMDANSGAVGGKKYKINVKGAAIGNGWFDPYNQYAVADFALSAGYIGLAEKRYWDAQELECQSKLASGNYNAKTMDLCYNLMDGIVKKTKNSDGKVPSVYDNRVWVRSQLADYPPGKKRVEAYLGNSQLSARVALMKQIHAEKNEQYGQIYRECNDPAYFALLSHDGEGVVPEITAILEDGSVSLMFFNGMTDIVCNHFGNEKVLDRLEWSQKLAWNKAGRYIWNGKGDGSQQAVGFLKQLGKLNLLKIPNAGHMLPMDLPEVALAMIGQFISVGGLGSKVAQQGMVGTDIDPSCDVCKAPGNDGSSHFDGVEKEVGVYGVINWIMLVVLVVACCAGRAVWRWYKERGAKGDKVRGKYTVLETIREENGSEVEMGNVDVEGRKIRGVGGGEGGG